MALFSTSEKWNRLIPLPMPPLWQVIYYEGMHGHHILFSQKDLRKFTKPHSSAHKWCIKVDKLTDTGLKLLAAASLQDMLHIIDTMTFQERFQIFRLYQIWLRETGRKIKTLAH